MSFRCRDAAILLHRDWYVTVFWPGEFTLPPPHITLKQGGRLHQVFQPLHVLIAETSRKGRFINHQAFAGLLPLEHFYLVNKK